MSTKSFFRTLAIVTMLCAACSKEEKVDPTDPNANFPDPEGTVTLSMRNANSGKTYLGDSYVYIDKADNFVGGEFVSLGAVKGLGNVSYIPKAGWSSQTAVTPGQGYVAYSSGKFYRMYVVRNTTNVANEIIGAEIKYQTPFGGADEAVSVPEKSLTFENEGGTKELLFTNKSIIPCVIEPEGCTATPIYADGNSFLPQGVRITAASNNSTAEVKGRVTIMAANGKSTEIAVTVRGSAPYIELGEALSVDCAATTRQITFSSNIPESELTFSSSAEGWCKVEYIGENILSLIISENTTASNRTATITVSSKDGKTKAELTVSQTKPTISLDKAEPITMTAVANGTATLTVTTGASQWDIKSDKIWCKVTKTGNVATITVDENNEGKERTAIVTALVNGNKEVSASLTVKQAPHTFALSSEQIDFDRQVRNTSITLTTTASGFSATSSDTSWCSLSWNDKTMTVRSTANDSQKNRTATITVKLADNQTKTIKVNQSRYMVGDYYNENRIEGVVYVLKPDFHGGIISMDEGSNLAWSTETVSTGATDQDDGMVYMDIIKKIPNWKTLYPAFAWCEAKNTNGVTGWYLPARNELQKIYTGRAAINATLQAKGKGWLSSNYYWSSSELDATIAWYVYFVNGYFYYGNKGSQVSVRSVSAF